MDADERSDLVAEIARLRSTVFKVRAENKELRRLAKNVSGMSRTDLKRRGDTAWHQPTSHSK